MPLTLTDFAAELLEVKRSTDQWAELAARWTDAAAGVHAKLAARIRRAVHRNEAEQFQYAAAEYYADAVLDLFDHAAKTERRGQHAE